MFLKETFPQEKIFLKETCNNVKTLKRVYQLFESHKIWEINFYGCV